MHHELSRKRTSRIHTREVESTLNADKDDKDRSCQQEVHDKPALLKKLRPHITVKDPAAQPIAGEADPALRDTENIPLTYAGGIEAFIENEVRPYAPDAYINEKKIEIGYEISFTKYFYRPLELRKIDEIVHDIRVVEDASNRLLNAVLNY